MHDVPNDSLKPNRQIISDISVTDQPKRSNSILNNNNE